MPLLLAIGAALIWIAKALGQFLLTTAFEVRKYAFKALAVAAAAGAFWIAFSAIYTGVKASLETVGAQVSTAFGSMGFSTDLGACLIPSTLPDALSALFGIVLAAVTTKWIRTVIFAKIA